MKWGGGDGGGQRKKVIHICNNIPKLSVPKLTVTKVCVCLCLWLISVSVSACVLAADLYLPVWLTQSSTTSQD